MTKIRSFDLFCGAGGSSCGARMAGVVSVGGVDCWETALEAYRLNFPSARVYGKKIGSLSATKVSEEVGRVDLLLASPECTNHSVAKGSAPRCEESRRTAFDVIRFAKAMQPRWIVVENVVSMMHWASYDKWLTRLKRLGYHCRELRLDAQNFGVAQSRRRLYVVCDRLAMPPEVVGDLSKRVPVKAVLGTGEGNGYNYSFRPLELPGRAAATLSRAQRGIDSVGRRKPFLLVYYGSDAAGGWQRLDRPLRTITTLDRFALVRPNGRGHEMRMLQPPELAAAMGFPEEYLWPDITRREHVKLIGNAVAPPVMEVIVKSLIRGTPRRRINGPMELEWTG